MTLSRRKVAVIITLVIVALGGLIALQTALLNYALKLKEQAFRRNVMAALGQISHGLATGEAIMVIFASDSADFLQVETHLEQRTSNSDATVRRFERHLTVADSLLTPAPPVWTEGDTIRYSLKSPQHVVLKVLDPAAGFDTVYVDSL